MKLHRIKAGNISSHALILLHGFLGMSDHWLPFAKQWAQYFYVIVPDLRNHGQSPHSNVFTYEAMVEDILELMEEENLKTATLLGHSMGGKVAMLTALNYPERVKSLVVVDIAPLAYKKTYSRQEDLLKKIATLDLTHFRTRKEIEEALIAKDANENRYIQLIIKNISRRSDGMFTWKFNLPVLLDSMDEIIGFPESNTSVSMPALFLKGKLSNYIEPDHEEVIKQLFPKAQIEVVKNAGHWVHVDSPAEFYERATVFLTSTMLEKK
jgi:pimeloyl-ACP methyl ester carboxylesterase